MCRRRVPSGRARLIVAGLFVMSAVGAAATGVPEAESGDVVVLITDHRAAIDDFSSLVVTIDGARLHRRRQVPEEGWVVLEAPGREVDLTRYKDGATYELIRRPVPAAQYDAAELMVTRARGVVTSGASVEVPLELSPARVAIDVRPDQVTQLTFDLVVHDLRDHPGKTWGVLLDEVRVAHVAAGMAMAHEAPAGDAGAAQDHANETNE